MNQGGGNQYPPGGPPPGPGHAQQPGYAPPQQPGYAPPQQPAYAPPQQPAYAPPQQAYGQPPGPPPGWPGAPPPPPPDWQGHAPLPPAHPGQPGYPPAPPSAPSFLAISFTRAFRLRILPREVLAAERQSLETASPPVIEPVVQAFLAWRRSLLFMIALALIPVSVLKAVEIFSQENPDDTVLGLQTIEWLSVVFFTVLSFILLNRWTSWSRQRRLLLIGFVIYFLTPFVVFLYPFRSLVDSGGGYDPAQQAQAALAVGLVMSVVAMLTLAPKAISLMPGLIRASIATKLLFPGSSAPGWLMVLAAPIYGLLVYIVLLVPYQITGSGLFVVGVAGLLGAQIWHGRLGYKLTRPVSAQEAEALVRSARAGYLILNLLGLVFILIALGELVELLDVGVLTIVNVILALFANVLLLTLIGTDIVILALERARGIAGDARTAEIIAVYNHSLSNFVAADASQSAAPPPPGPPPPYRG